MEGEAEAEDSAVHLNQKIRGRMKEEKGRRQTEDSGVRVTGAVWGREAEVSPTTDWEGE